MTSIWRLPINDRNGERSRISRAQQRAQKVGDLRSGEQLHEHYLVERGLADRLRVATKAQRRGLYCELYDELFRQVRHHPQLQRTDRVARQREVDGLLEFMRGFLTSSTVFMEVGPGDCALAIRAAAIVKQVYAIDVSEQITRGVLPPANFQLVLSDGCSIPVPERSIDLAFSNQLMEHLHPDDAREQLQNIYRSLAPGGIYICITPNRLHGPHDVSRYFDRVATGFHLLEYTARDLHRQFADAGFTRMQFHAAARGRMLRVPYWSVAFAEVLLGALPGAMRQAIADSGPMRALLGLRLSAQRPPDA